MQRRQQLQAKHPLRRRDTLSGVEGGMVPKKKTAEPALHGSCGLLNQSSTARRRSVRPDNRGGVIGGRCNVLDTVSFVKCPYLIGHELCAIASFVLHVCPIVGKTLYTFQIFRGWMDGYWLYPLYRAVACAT